MASPAFRRQRRRKRPPAAAVKQRAPMTYYQVHTDLVLNSLGAGSSVAMKIVDNSAEVSNEVVNFRKLTMSWYTIMTTSSAVIWGIVRQTQDGTIPVMSSDSVVRNLRNENHLLRGPSLMPTRPNSDNDQWRKTVVLKNITLDQDDDLLLVVTNLDIALASSGNNLHAFMKGWYRVVS